MALPAVVVPRYAVQVLVHSVVWSNTHPPTRNLSVQAWLPRMAPSHWVTGEYFSVHSTKIPWYWTRTVKQPAGKRIVDTSQYSVLS